MLKVIKKIKYPLTIIIALIIIILIINLKINLNSSEHEIIQKEELLPIESNKDNNISESNNLCMVDIKGAIKNPGVYLTECSNNVNDVIKLAGGLLKNSDTSLINLAKKVTDEMVIIIYTKDEVKNSNIVNTVIKTVEKECICPNIQNDGCINDEITDNIGESKLVNINTASLEELLTLPGIGESKAKAIIKYRTENDNFKTIDEILNVDGIGQKLYEEIKAYITI